MKKYLIYIGVLSVGVLLGWFLFGGAPSIEKEEHNHAESTETNQIWTCSMHPQIRQPEPGNCPICGMELILAESSADGFTGNQFALSENAMALANIQTTIVGKNKKQGSTTILSGKIVENKETIAIQPAHFNGRIDELYITSLGEKVTKGQAIAKVYSPELVAAQQELITAYKLRNSQPQLYEAVLSKFKNWKVHGLQLDEVLKTGTIKSSFTIYAHVSGVITEISVSSGAHIMDGKPMFKVANLGTVWASFDVYENQLALFKKGQPLKITTKAYPNKIYKAKVSYIDPILNSQTRTVTLRAVLSNKDQILKPGMFVEGKVESRYATKETRVTIPSSAVLWTGKRSVVYVKVNANQPVFELREITLGNKEGTTYLVLEGLSIGDEIVTNGVFTIDAAAQLQGKKSMMNKTVSKVTTGYEEPLRLENKTTMMVSLAFQKQLKTLFNDYIKLKNALVNDDAEIARIQAEKLLHNLSKIDVQLLKDDKADRKWTYLDEEIKIAAISISKTSDIKLQRDSFKNLSLSVSNAIEVFGINEKAYLQYCPMGDQNKGVYWLSKQEKVSNPYFGNAMLTCGEVKQVIN